MPRANQTLNKIDELVASNREYYGEEIAIAADVAGATKQLTNLADGYEGSDAYPLPDGGIQLVLSRDNVYIEIDIRPDMLFDFYAEKAGMAAEREFAISLDETKKRIERWVTQ